LLRGGLQMNPAEGNPLFLQQKALPVLAGAQEDLVFPGKLSEDAERLPQAIFVKVNQTVIQNDGQWRLPRLGKEPDQSQTQGEIHLVDRSLAELFDLLALTGFGNKDAEADSVG